MTGRHTASSITDTALTALYDQRDQLRVMYNAACANEEDLINERDHLRTRLGAALASTRLLRIYAGGLDHGRQVDASDVAHRIRRILTGIDDRPAGDPEPQRQLAAAIEALGVSETENAELRARITTLEHVAAGNKRHVQLIVPELERAVAERDQHAATVQRALAECDRIAQLPAVADDSGRADTFDTGARWTLRMIQTALTGSCPGCAVPGCGCAGAAQADTEGSAR